MKRQSFPRNVTAEGGIQPVTAAAPLRFDGRYQVKGIGANPLVEQVGSLSSMANCQTRRSPTMEQMLAQTLPYGAARTRVCSPTAIPGDFTRTRPLSPRPSGSEPQFMAHFERTPYFGPKPEYAELNSCMTFNGLNPCFARRTICGPHRGLQRTGRSRSRRRCLEGMCQAHPNVCGGVLPHRFLMLTTSSPTSP